MSAGILEHKLFIVYMEKYLDVDAKLIHENSTLDYADIRPF